MILRPTIPPASNVIFYERPRQANHRYEEMLELQPSYSVPEQGVILLLNPKEAQGDVQRVFRVQIETKAPSGTAAGASVHQFLIK